MIILDMVSGTLYCMSVMKLLVVMLIITPPARCMVLDTVTFWSV